MSLKAWVMIGAIAGFGVAGIVFAPAQHLQTAINNDTTLLSLQAGESKVIVLSKDLNGSVKVNVLAQDINGAIMGPIGATGPQGAKGDPANYQPGIGITTADSAIAVDDSVIPEYYTGTTAPAIPCKAGRDFYVDTAAGSLYFCKQDNQWQGVQSAN